MLLVVSDVAEDCSCNAAWTAIISEFAKIDALPGSEIKSSIGYGYSD